MYHKPFEVEAALAINEMKPKMNVLNYPNESTRDYHACNLLRMPLLLPQDMSYRNMQHVCLIHQGRSICRPREFSWSQQPPDSRIGSPRSFRRDDRGMQTATESPLFRARVFIRTSGSYFVPAIPDLGQTLPYLTTYRETPKPSSTRPFRLCGHARVAICHTLLSDNNTHPSLLKTNPTYRCKYPILSARGDRQLV